MEAEARQVKDIQNLLDFIEQYFLLLRILAILSPIQINPLSKVFFLHRLNHALKCHSCLFDALSRCFFLAACNLPYSREKLMHDFEHLRVLHHSQRVGHSFLVVGLAVPLVITVYFVVVRYDIKIVLIFGELSGPLRLCRGNVAI
jgi:hypothetical protein